MEEILLTYKASRNIIRCSRTCKVETGGILAGILKPPAVVAAGSPGPDSIHQPHRFTSDPAADETCLAEAQRQYGQQITAVGWWHKHPAGLTTPSQGDLDQARQLAGEYNDDQPVVICIVDYQPNRTRRRTSLNFYSCDCRGNLLEHTWRLVPAKDEGLLDAISKAPVRPETKTTGFWSDADFQSYLNPVGRKRIIGEIAAMKDAGWAVKVARHKQDKSLLLNTCKGSRRLRFVLPPEFPLNPPTVYAGDGRRFRGLQSLAQWNSLTSLVGVAAEALSVMDCLHCSKKCLGSYQDDQESAITESNR